MSKLERYEYYCKRALQCLFSSFLILVLIGVMMNSFGTEIKRHGTLVMLLNVTALSAFLWLIFSLFSGIFFLGRYVYLRQQASQRARRRIEEARANGHVVPPQVEFIFYEYERGRDPEEKDSEEMAALLAPSSLRRA